jgi:hypothetical protein
MISLERCSEKPIDISLTILNVLQFSTLSKSQKKLQFFVGSVSKPPLKKILKLQTFSFFIRFPKIAT